YHFMNVSVVEGSGMVDGQEIKKGAHFILPYEYGKVSLCGKMELIVSYI
ncbi:MAG: mannose-6-phosphate isomerase, partial [Clostridia bacterium]|nr:mannose-6-phosphate isomerase [Clostridia bacterium]